MDEFRFVIRCFIFAALIIMLSRVQFADETLESRAESFLQDSETAHFLQQSAEGGVRVAEKFYWQSKSFIQNKMAQLGDQSEPSFKFKSKPSDLYEEDRE